MAEVISIVNQKGGVAKTTTTIHIGVAIAELDKRILLVDLDSQGHLAEGFGIVADGIEHEMSDVFRRFQEDHRHYYAQYPAQSGSRTEQCATSRHGINSCEHAIS